MAKKITKETVGVFEKLQTQLDSLYEEVNALSKKKPDSPINKFKLKFINQLIKELNEFLKVEDRPFANFTEFNEDDLPTNSDIVFILSQYLNCLEKFRSDNVHQDRFYNWFWDVNGEEIKTAMPKKLKG